MTTSEATAGYPGGADKARQPGGTPVGGRFATMTRQEPDVTLANLSDEDYNLDILSRLKAGDSWSPGSL
jgi:hypothetical protein